MKQRFRFGEDGTLVGRDGLVYGRVETITIELFDEPIDPSSQGEGDRQLSLNNHNDENNNLPPTPRQQLAATIERIWAHYVEVMKPRRTEIDPQARVVIRNALLVANEKECLAAIDGCKASPHHMGQNDRHKKYNRITQILKGKQGGKTTREQIDMFLDFLAKSGKATNGPAPVPSGVIESLKDAVRSYAHTGAEQERAERAKATLIEKGIFSDVLIDRANERVEFVR